MWYCDPHQPVPMTPMRGLRHHREQPRAGAAEDVRALGFAEVGERVVDEPEQPPVAGILRRPGEVGRPQHPRCAVRLEDHSCVLDQIRVRIDTPAERVLPGEHDVDVREARELGHGGPARRRHRDVPVRAQGEVVEHDLELRDRLEDLDEPRVVGRMEVRPQHQVLGGEPREQAGIGVEIEDADAVCASRFDAAPNILLGGIVDEDGSEGLRVRPEALGHVVIACRQPDEHGPLDTVTLHRRKQILDRSLACDHVDVAVDHSARQSST